MIRGKSPRSDVEMTKKLNFVAAILDFWRASWIDIGNLISLYSIYGYNHLYQFWCFYHKVNDRCTIWLDYGRFLVLTEFPGGEPEFPGGEITGSHPVLRLYKNLELKIYKKRYFTGSDFHRRTLRWLSYSSPVPLQYKYMIYVICGLTQKKINYLLTCTNTIYC